MCKRFGLTEWASRAGQIGKVKNQQTSRFTALMPIGESVGAPPLTSARRIVAGEDRGQYLAAAVSECPPIRIYDAAVTTTGRAAPWRIKTKPGAEFWRAVRRL